MNFEDLIWIILFLVYVVWVIIKKVRAASKTSEKGVAKRLPKWKERLNKFMSQVQQMDREGDTLEDLGPIRLPKWKERLNNFMSQARQMAREGDTLEDLGPIRKEISSERIEQAIEKPPLPKIKPALVKADAESIEPAVFRKEILPKDLEFGIQDLRKAVIWSEILAPPLALRDE